MQQGLVPGVTKGGNEFTATHARSMATPRPDTMTTSSVDDDGFSRWRRTCERILSARGTPRGPAYAPPRGTSMGASRMLYPSWPWVMRTYSVHAPSDASDASQPVATEATPTPANAPNVGEVLAQMKDEETQHQRMERERVEQWTEELLRTSPIVRFMVKHLTLVNCSPLAQQAVQSTDAPPASASPSSIPPIVIAPCPPNIAGGFSPSAPDEPPQRSGILLCSNRIHSKRHLQDTLSHEMVHWWDHCRFRVDWSDLRHHACSEIRAAALSGDCLWTREVSRLNLGFAKQHQACARRRAVLSIEANPACTSREHAERVVDEVFPSCWSDTRPFDEIY